MTKNSFKHLGNRGFTLIEITVVMIIFGVLISLGMMGLRYYIGNKGYENTITALDKNNLGLIMFQATYRRYPCPANPQLAEDHPDYGYEDCSLTPVAGARDADGNGTPDPVLIGAFPFNTILDPDRDGVLTDGVFFETATAKMLNDFVTASGKEGDKGGGGDTGGGDPIGGGGSGGSGGDDTVGGGSGIDPVEPIDPPCTGKNCFDPVDINPVICTTKGCSNDGGGSIGGGGSVGSSGGYTAHYGYDGYGNKFTYAVTQSQTSAATFNQDFGAIDIQTEVRQSIIENPGSAHFVLFSHGQNGKGAYSKDGKLVSQCVLSVVNPIDPPPVVTTIHELENCDRADAVFVDGLRNDTRERHYDDHLSYTTSIITSLWGYSTPVLHNNGTPANPNDDFWVNRINNLNGGDVGVGTPNPQQRLHVVGDLQANKIITEQVCGENSNSPCMPIAAIAGEMLQMQCSSGKIAVAIEDNSVKCENPFSSIPAGSCPPGQRVYGISSRDGILCR